MILGEATLIIGALIGFISVIYLGYYMNKTGGEGYYNY